MVTAGSGLEAHFRIRHHCLHHRPMASAAFLSVGSAYGGAQFQTSVHCVHRFFSGDEPCQPPHRAHASLGTAGCATEHFCTVICNVCSRQLVGTCRPPHWAHASLGTAGCATEHICTVICNVCSRQLVGTISVCTERLLAWVPECSETTWSAKRAGSAVVAFDCSPDCSAQGILQPLTYISLLSLL